MRVSPLFRLTAFVALLVFSAGWSEDALVLHPCPHHAAIAHGGMAGHAAHADGHHAAARRHAPDAPAPEHKGPCSCIVACAGTAFAMAAPRADVRVPQAADRAAPLPRGPTPAALPGRRQHVQPFPTAPPVLPA